MYGIVLLSVLGGWGPACGYPPREWCACHCPRTKGGLIVLYWNKKPGVGPEAEQEWKEYVCALETWERPEMMYLWHRADVVGKWCLLNQVRRMKLDRDAAEGKEKMDEKMDEKKDEKKDKKIDEKRIEKDKDENTENKDSEMARRAVPAELPLTR